MIDAMTLTEAGEIFRYWEHDPPAHLIGQAIARFLGWTPQPTPSRPPKVEQIVASAPPGLAVAHHGELGLPAPVLDAQALRAHNRARAAEIARRGQNDAAQQLPGTLGGA